MSDAHSQRMSQNVWLYFYIENFETEFMIFQNFSGDVYIINYYVKVKLVQKEIQYPFTKSKLK